jgi:serine/threonine-protein kinase
MAERERSSNCGVQIHGNAFQSLSSTCPPRAATNGPVHQPADSSQTTPAFRSGDGAEAQRNDCVLSGFPDSERVIGIGATLNERFTLDAELGSGGMGSVYRATDKVLGRNVAIKFLKDSHTKEQAEQIRLEAQILARLVHDRIVRLYDFGESAGTYFLVMEEVNGPSFANRWRELYLGDRLRICAQVAEALHYAHLQGVIHRDVKPSNVLLTPGDEAKLSDFGLSLLIGDSRDESGTIRGTPLYMSPEQAQGMPPDHRADLYSVGVMLYQCATGDVPFDGDALSVIAQHKTAAPEPPRFKNPEIWSTLDKLILSLLEKRRSRRPGSGNVVALQLFEEAERAGRLQRINPRVRRSDTPGTAVSPPSGRFNAGDTSSLADALIARLDAARGAGPVGPGTSVPSMTQPPSSGLSQIPDATGPGASRPEASSQSSIADRTTDLGAHVHPAAREMLDAVLAAPIVLSPEDRYLCGHYLAYLLGGSQRRGFFFRRWLDSRNADRARLMLAMTWLSSVGPTDEEIDRAAKLLDDRPDVRPALSPVVVMKYLASRDTFGKRKRFREIRKRLQDASAYARKAMLNARGELNPGLMPRTLADLALIAPPRDTLDAHRVSLWNRVAEAWRRDGKFRQAVLHYATRSDQLDAGSADLWPEVVYPLIERAHRQRTFRPRYEALWDYVVGKLLRVPLAGVRLDRMMIIAIPVEVTEQLDLDLSTVVDEARFSEDLSTFLDDSRLDLETASTAESQATRQPRPIYVGGVIPREEQPDDDDAPRVKPTVPLSPPGPFQFTHATLRKLWEEATDAHDKSAGPPRRHRTIPVGPYELAVVPTGGGRQGVRSGSTIRAILLGLQQRGKQIEMFTPPAQATGCGSRPVIAIWTYQDGSVAIVYVDFQYKEHYILWDAPGARQINYDYAEELRQALSTMNLEVSGPLLRILS